MKEQIKPGMFGIAASADTRRGEYDNRNEQCLRKEICADVIFFGDSITHFWELELYFNREILKINRGIGGDTVVNAARRFEADVLQLEPKAIVILLGINDLLKTAPDLWNKAPGADTDEIIENIEKSYRDMLSKCEGIDVYVCSILPQSLCPPFDREHFKKNIIRTNEILKQLCREYGATYVDYYNALTDDGGFAEEYSVDGVHPNGMAYEIMAEVLKESLEIL